MGQDRPRWIVGFLGGALALAGIVVIDHLTRGGGHGDALRTAVGDALHLPAPEALQASPADDVAPRREEVAMAPERLDPLPPEVRPLTSAEVSLLLPALQEKEFLAETKRYQKLETYGEASVDHIAARYAQTKTSLLKEGVEAGRGLRAFSSQAIEHATRPSPPGTATIHAHVRGMDILVPLEGEEAETWRRASQEVETAMRRIAPPPMIQRLPPGLQQARPETQSK